MHILHFSLSLSPIFRYEMNHNCYSSLQRDVIICTSKLLWLKKGRYISNYVIFTIINAEEMAFYTKNGITTPKLVPFCQNGHLISAIYPNRFSTIFMFTLIMSCLSFRPLHFLCSFFFSILPLSSFSKIYEWSSAIGMSVFLLNPLFIP